MRFLVEESDHDEGDNAERQVDVENPFPCDIVRNVSAEQRPENAGHAEHRAEQSAQLAAVFRRNGIEHDREGDRYERAAADALNRAVDAQCTMESAVPHRIDPSMNTKMPKMKNFLRPYISDSLPKIGMPAISATI